MFPRPIRIEKRLFKDEWTLLEPFEYICKNTQVVAPEGFWTDFASVPRLPVIYLLVGNTGHEAAVIHDYLYRKDAQPAMSKADADGLFYRALLEMGLSFIHARMMYRGVQIGGESSYHKRYVAYRGE